MTSIKINGKRLAISALALFHAALWMSTLSYLISASFTWEWNRNEELDPWTALVANLLPSQVRISWNYVLLKDCPEIKGAFMSERHFFTMASHLGSGNPCSPAELKVGECLLLTHCWWQSSAWQLPSQPVCKAALPHMSQWHFEMVA